MDNLTKEQRHKNMRNIRSSDTSIEVKLRKELWARGFRYRKNYAALPGKPDIALTKYKIAVFVTASSFMEKTGGLETAFRGGKQSRVLEEKDIKEYGAG